MKHDAHPISNNPSALCPRLCSSRAGPPHQQQSQLPTQGAHPINNPSTLRPCLCIPPVQVSWHEGAHLISNNPSGSKTFSMIQDKIAKYFGIEHKSVGTRFNWYVHRQGAGGMQAVSRQDAGRTQAGRKQDASRARVVCGQHMIQD